MSKVGLYTKIDDLSLTVRVRNAFHIAGIMNIRQLIDYSGKDLLLLENFGKLSLSQVREELKVHGFELRDEPTPKELQQQHKLARLEVQVAHLQRMLELLEKETARLKGYVQSGAIDLRRASSNWITAERGLEYRVQQIEQRLGLRVLGVAS